MYQNALTLLVTIGLMMPVSSALAQDKSDLRVTLPTQFKTHFNNGTLNLDGTILNTTSQRYDCLDLTFRTATEKGVRTGTVSVIDLASRERKNFGLRLPPGKGAEHVATLPCETPVAVTDTVAEETQPESPAPQLPVPPPPAPQPQIDQTCTLAGQLNSDRGFSAQFKEHPNGPNLTSVLDTAVLMRNRQFAMSAPMDVRGNTAYYEFPDVPLGMTFELGLGGGWYFLSGELPELRCVRAGSRQHVPPEAVGFR